jgi:hypothetical protein
LSSTLGSWKSEIALGRRSSYIWAVSTTALHIVELVKSLPREEQEAICVELAKHASELNRPRGRQPQRLGDGTYYNPEGIPDDDPFFEIMEGQDAAR